MERCRHGHKEGKRACVVRQPLAEAGLDSLGALELRDSLGARFGLGAQGAGMLAPDGRCKALDAAADGYVRRAPGSACCAGNMQAVSAGSRCNLIDHICRMPQSLESGRGGHVSPCKRQTGALQLAGHKPTPSKFICAGQCPSSASTDDSL